MYRPDFSFEKKYWDLGFDLVIGVDEVGRGSLAGPVVAGAAVLNQDNLLSFNKFMLQPKNAGSINRALLESILKWGINDSKKMTSEKRVKLAKIIPKYFVYSLGEASVSEINELGIVKATERAMRMAIRDLTMKRCNNETMFLLLDAFPLRHVPGIGMRNQLAIIRGDEKSVTIAAASIMAKVYRDSLMEKLAREYPIYTWSKNKGYGTKGHISFIKTNGVCREHREKFVDEINNHPINTNKPILPINE